MKKSFKLLFIIFSLCFIFMFYVSASADVNVDELKTKLGTSASYEGKHFTARMFDSYYKVTVDGKSQVTLESNVKLFKCSDKEYIPNLADAGIPRTCIPAYNTLVGFSHSLPKGYSFTFLNGLNITDNDTRIYENSNVRDDNANYLSFYFRGRYTSIYTNGIIQTTEYFPISNRDYNYATLYAVGDVVKVNVNVKQMQVTWFGHQEVFSLDTCAYILCNIHEWVEYSN